MSGFTRPDKLLYGLCLVVAELAYLLLAFVQME